MAQTCTDTSAWWPIMLHVLPCQMIFEIYEDMVQILLMLMVFFTQYSEVEDLFCGASPDSELSLICSDNLFILRFELVQDDFQHDLTWITDGADGSVVLAEL